MIVVIFASIWLFGFALSLEIIPKLEDRNPPTLRDSWTEDHGLVLALAHLWPIFWPAFLFYKIVIFLTSIAVGAGDKND